MSYSLQPPKIIYTDPLNNRIIPDPANVRGEWVICTWDDIEFDKDKISLKSNKLKRIYPSIPLKGSLHLLDRIKEDYFERLYPKTVLKFYFDDGKFIEDKSRGYQVIKDLIDAALEFVSFKFYKTKLNNRICKFNRHSSSQVRNLFNDRISRNQFFKFLAQKHSEEFNIIPIEEYQNGLWEESFIFRLRTGSGRILIVWENPQPGRATYLFITDDHSLETQLAKIESYIISATDGKRDYLNETNTEAKVLRKELKYTNEKVYHKKISDYKVKIQMDINRY